VDPSGRTDRGRTGRHRPGAHLAGEHREEADQPEHRVAGADQPRQHRFVEPERHQIALRVLNRQVTQFGLQLACQDDTRGSLPVGERPQGRGLRTAVGKTRLIHIGDVDHRPLREESQISDQRVPGPIHALSPHGHALREFLGQVAQHRRLLARPCRPGFDAGLQTLDRVLHGLQIRERKLGLHDVRVAHGIRRPFHMADIGRGKDAHHVHDGIHVTDVGQEAVPQALARRRAADQTGTIDEPDGGRDDALGVGD